MDIYAEKVEAVRSVSGEGLGGLMRGLNIEIESVTSQIYKIWVATWSIYSLETKIRRYRINGESSEKEITLFTPAYVYFPEEKSSNICFLAVDYEAFRRVKEILRKLWDTKSILHLPSLKDRVPEDMEVASASKIIKESKTQVLENYAQPVKMKDVVQGSWEAELFNVTLWSTKGLGGASLHAVTLQSWSGEVIFRVELPAPEELFFRTSENEFISPLAEIAPLFYSGEPADIQKACIG